MPAGLALVLLGAVALDEALAGALGNVARLAHNVSPLGARDKADRAGGRRGRRGAIAHSAFAGKDRASAGGGRARASSWIAFRTGCETAKDAARELVIALGLGVGRGSGK